MLGVVTIQLLFLDSLLPRLDPRGMSAGALLGILLWLVLGRGLLIAVSSLSAGLASFGRLPGSVWQLRWVFALLLWWMWLLGGRWGWPTAMGAAWVIGPWSWWWFMSWLAAFGFAAAGVAGYPLQRLALTWLGLSLVAGASLLFAGWMYSGRLAVGVDLRLLGQQGGILTGLLAALVVAAVMPKMRTLPASRYRHLLPRLMATLMIAVAMLPLEPALGLADIPDARLTLSPYALVQQFYQLIRDAMLWFPVGFIYVIAERQRLMWLWMATLCAALLLVLLPWFAQWPLALPASIGAAFAGLLSGAWLARNSRLAIATVLVADPLVPVQGELSDKQTHSVAEVLASPKAPAAAEAGRSSGFRHRQQRPDTAVADVPAKTGWRARGVTAGDRAGDRAGGFRTRSSIPISPADDDEQG